MGLAFWAMLTEIVRRWAREYDRYIIADASEQLRSEKEKYPEEFEQHERRTFFAMQNSQLGPRVPKSRIGRMLGSVFNPTYVLHQHQMRLRPTLIQQIVRSILYAIQFTSAYLIMLVVMSFNAYVFISVVLGAMLGHFVASWDTLGAVPYESVGHCAPTQPDRLIPSQTRSSEATMNACGQQTKLPEAAPITPAAAGLPMEGEAAVMDSAPAPAIDDCHCGSLPTANQAQAVNPHPHPSGLA